MNGIVGIRQVLVDNTAVIKSTPGTPATARTNPPAGGEFGEANRAAAKEINLRKEEVSVVKS